MMGLGLMLAAALALPSRAWNFAVSGDSRDCGDVVMPAVAAGAAKDGAVFYWHLGDLRRIYGIDEDMAHQPEHLKRPLTKERYYALAWDDVVASQIRPFGRIPVYIGIGNHETVPPMSRAKFDAKFRRWRPGGKRSKSYFAWTRGPVAFLYLDNATTDQFDEAQLSWFEQMLAGDLDDPGISSIVVGMHEALPESISSNHGMDDSDPGRKTGRRVYEDLVAARRKGRRVYVLASHSHYYMSNVYNTEFWRAGAGVLAGWIVGTAGAERIPLPEGASQADEALADVYGYLLGSVDKDGKIAFRFEKIEPAGVPAPTARRYGASFVRWCFDRNKRQAP